ncbi:MAG: DNA cytosine methyltransferase [Nitrospirae bacterium]|nr:DNA cytosine methyltransferase [Nitrospirota bacterium]
MFIKEPLNMLTSIDLFCGAGGITAGFRQVGYRSLYANDIMKEAIDTFAWNNPDVMAECLPVEQVDPAEIMRRIGLEASELDVLVGGPPCQGFSINAPERFMSDPRNKLFRHYARFLEVFRPKTFLFENVPGLLSLEDGKIFRQILEVFRGLGYHVTVKIMFAAHYGVPQERWRLILLGSLYGDVRHPEPTHYATGRANFRSGGTLTFKLGDFDRLMLLPYVTVADAINDLPVLRMGEGSEVVGYTSKPHGNYARELRNHEGITYNHYASRLAKQNVERMKYVKPGGSWRDIPHDLLPKGMQRARKSDHTKRYGRLRNDGLAGTVMTKCDPHWGAVFLPEQDRVLTVREAARLQSFPDAYKFLGSRVSQYVQVGNAVPVMMARAIALSLREHIESHTITASKTNEAVYV